MTPEWQQLKQEANNRIPSPRVIFKNWKTLLTLKFWKTLAIELFWDLDFIGILFVVFILGLILVPLTLAGGITSKWAKASTIVPLVIGFVSIPFFIIWEAKVAHMPIMPLPLMKDRGVWAALMIGIMINWVWNMPNGFMYTVLVVGMRASTKAATRITSLYIFVTVTVGANDGIESQKYLNGVIGGLILMGFGTGFLGNSTLVSITTVTNHEYMGVIISLYLASYYVGSAIGVSLSGAIWTNKMCQVILNTMNDMGIRNSAKLTLNAYQDPFTFIITNTWGTPERIAVVVSYAKVQRYLCIAGLALCVPLLVFCLFLRDHRLESVQSLESGDVEKKVVVNDNDIIAARFKRIFHLAQH